MQKKSGLLGVDSFFLLKNLYKLYKDIFVKQCNKCKNIFLLFKNSFTLLTMPGFKMIMKKKEENKLRMPKGMLRIY